MYSWQKIVKSNRSNKSQRGRTGFSAKVADKSREGGISPTPSTGTAGGGRRLQKIGNLLSLLGKKNEMVIFLMSLSLFISFLL